MADDDKDEKDKNDKDEKPAPAPSIAAGLDRRWKIFGIVALLNLLADQVTKFWARASLADDVSRAGLSPRGVLEMDPAAAKALLDAPCAIPHDLITNILYQTGKGPVMVSKCIGDDVPFLGKFWQWKLSMNTGSAFGLFGSSPNAARVFLSIVGLLAVAGMIYMLRKCRPDQRILQWALAFVAGGAVGNLIDRMYFGAVTDMVSWDLKFMRWPTFNVADVSLVIGVGLMFIDIQKEGKREKAEKAKKREAREAKKKKLKEAAAKE